LSFGASINLADMLSVPLQVSGPHGKYHVNVSGLEIAGHRLPAKPNRAQLDSASTLTYLPKDLYVQLRQAIKDFCKQRSRCGGAEPPPGGNGLEVCWRLRKSHEGFPTVTWILQNGVKVEWRPEAYMLRQGSQKKFCYTFAHARAPLGETGIVLGASWMVDQELVFDIHQRRLGIASASCKGVRPRRSRNMGRSSLLAGHKRRVAPPDTAGHSATSTWKPGQTRKPALSLSIGASAVALAETKAPVSDKLIIGQREPLKPLASDNLITGQREPLFLVSMMGLSVYVLVNMSKSWQRMAKRCKRNLK